MTTAVHPIARLPAEWRTDMAARGERRFRAQQVFSWIHQRAVMDAAQMTNLSKALRTQLLDDGLVPPVSVARTHLAGDGTRKLAVALADDAQVETVLLPVGARGAADDANAAAADLSDDEQAGTTRVTQCISTQVGCAMACVFCASGMAGPEPPPDCRRDRGAGAAGPRAQLKARRAAEQRGLHGHGRAAAQLSSRRRAASQLLTHPEGHRPVAPPHHRIDLRPGARNRSARAATSAASVGLADVAAQRR